MSHSKPSSNPNSAATAFSLDHVVINALFEMDRAAALMSQLGFTLTPRGFHSLGSINHLMMFEGHYLELVGLPSGTDMLRKEVLESPLGLNGLVFRTDDAEACASRLRASGLAMQAPQSFSRPVTIDGVEQLACFRTTRTAPELFEAGRVYYCQHDTPELVWQPQWMSHANGCSGLRELVVVTTTLETDAVRYAKATQAPAQNHERNLWTIDLIDAFRISLMSPPRYRDRYGDLGAQAHGRHSFFGAVVFETADIARIGHRAAPLPDFRSRADEHSLVLLAPSLNTVFEFRHEAHHR
jgi:hypothetical protein